MRSPKRKAFGGGERKKGSDRQFIINWRRAVLLAGAYIMQKVAVKDVDEEETVVTIILPSSA